MPKRVPPLTAAQVTNLKPDLEKVVELVDGAVPGLRLRVTPAGTRTWSLNMRAAGVMRRFDVGTGMGLAEARRKGDELRRQIRGGADPTAERRITRARAKDAGRGIGTLGAIIEDYFTIGPGAGLASKDEQKRRLRFVFSEHLSRPGLEVGEVDLQVTVDRHGAKTAAGRAVAYLGPVLKWAAKRGLMQRGFDLEKPNAHSEDEDGVGQRFLTDDELKAILPHLIGPHGRCCKFLLLTAARLREATEARWSEIDFDTGTWTIAPARRKDTRSRNRKKQVPAVPHIIPLSVQALELLQEVRAKELARRQAAEIPDKLNENDLIFIGERGGMLQNWDRWLKHLAPKTGVSGWSAHALRRTAATLAADRGAEPHIVSIILGHKNIGGQLTAGYSKSRYRSEHAEALQRLANHIGYLMAPED